MRLGEDSLQLIAYAAKLGVIVAEGAHLGETCAQLLLASVRCSRCITLQTNAHSMNLRFEPGESTLRMTRCYATTSPQERRQTVIHTKQRLCTACYAKDM